MLFARFLEWKKLLQNTGPLRFRQCGFLDFPPTPGYNFWFLTPGGVAQLGERLNGIQEVRGSIPLASIGYVLRLVTFQNKLVAGAMWLPGGLMAFAGIAQLVEHNLAKVGVAGSSPVSRSGRQHVRR